jgi:hypothetical protein
MRILVSESPDKQTHQVLTVSVDQLLGLLESDHGLHEIIPMCDPDRIVRPFFDVDVSDGDLDSGEVLDTVLTRLNTVFDCSDGCWAIASRCRPGKISFHLVGHTRTVSLRELRRIAAGADLKDLVDDTVYWPPLWNTAEEGSFCLPNQSKDGINKEGGPLVVLQGSLRDFLVTEVTGCH